MSSDVSDHTRAPENFHLELPAGVTPWQDLLDRLPQLSGREREVLLLLGAGASNRSIASRLQVTERTVKAHVAQVLAKLGVESRLQAGLASLMFQLNGSLRQGIFTATALPLPICSSLDKRSIERISGSGEA